MQSTHAQARSASNNRKLPKKPWLKLINARNLRKIFEEAAKLAEQTQPAVTVAPVAKEAPVDTRRKKQARPDKERDDYDHEEDGPKKTTKESK